MTIKIDNHTQSDGYIYIYTDGSHFEVKQKIGTGFAIKSAQEGVKPIIVSTSHNNAPKRAPSLCAEALAVLDALKELPENSNVFILTDEIKIANFLNQNKQEQQVATARMEISILRSVLEQLSEACAKKKHITSERVDHDRPIDHEEAVLTTAAHNAAADGSGASSHKKIPDMSSRFSTEHADYKPRHTNNSGFDIIEPDDGAEALISYPDPRDKGFQW